MPLTKGIGSIAEGTQSAANLTEGKGFALRFECTESITLEELEVEAGEVSTLTGLRVAIFTDVGELPGSLLAGTPEAEATGLSEVKKGTKIKVTGLSATIVKGTFYWLAFIPKGGALKYRRGSVTGYSASTNGSLAKLSSATWGAKEAKGPAYIAGFGTVSGGEVHSGSGSSSIGVRSQGAGIQIMLGSGVTRVGVRSEGEGHKVGIGSGLGSSSVGVRSTSTGRIALQSGHGYSSVGMRSEGEGAKAAGLTNAYYGPGGEAATEATRLAEGKSTRIADIYPAAAPGAPVVVIAHGGGWASTSSGAAKNGKKVTAGNAAKLQEEGCTVYNIEYRTDIAESKPGGPVKAFPIEVADLEEAVAFALATAASHNGDPSKLVLLGGSAGGHLVATAAGRLNAVMRVVKKVIALSGIYQFPILVNEMENAEGTWADPTGTEKNFPPNVQTALGCTFIPAGTLPTGEGVKFCATPGAQTAYNEAWSPALQSVGRSANYLLYTAVEDLIPVNQPAAMVTQITGAGGRVDERQIAGKGHAFSYWPSVVHEIVAFIFAPEGEGSSSVGVRSSGQGRQIMSGKGSTTVGARSAGMGRQTQSSAGSTHVGIRSEGEGRKANFPIHTGAGVSSVGINSTGQGHPFAHSAGSSSVGVRSAGEGRQVMRGSGSSSGGCRSGGQGRGGIEAPSTSLVGVAGSTQLIYATGGES